MAFEWLRKLNPWAGGKKADSESGVKNDRTVYCSMPWVRFFARKSVWNDIETMDGDEPIVARGLDFVANFSTTFTDGTKERGFVLEGPADELAVLGPLASTLQAESWEDTRYPLKFGDGFAEVVFDKEAMRITGLNLFPYSYQIAKNTDKHGALETGDPEQAMKSHKAEVPAYAQYDDNGTLVAAFWPYQIAHFGFGRRQGLPYHEPQLGCVISASKRLRAMKDGLSIARLTRAFQKIVHKIPMPLGIDPDEAAATIKEYRELMGTDTTIPYNSDAEAYALSSKETPMSADTTFWIPKFYNEDGSRTVDGEIHSLDADSANLENLEDVYLLIREVLCAGGVPADFLNYSVGQKAFVDKTSPEKREAFLYLVAAVQDAYITVIRWVLDMELLLNGINPLTAKYEIITPRISPKEAEMAAKIDVQRANAAAVWKKLGIPKQVIGGRLLQLTDVEIEAWMNVADPKPPEGVDPDEQMDLWKRTTAAQLGGVQPEEANERGIITTPESSIITTPAPSDS